MHPATAVPPLSGQSLCVVGMSYAPEPTGIAPYTAGLAEMLVDHGAQVEVYAGIPHYPSWRVRPEDRFRLRSEEIRNGVLVRRARHYVPGRQTAVARLAWEVTFLANAGALRPRRRPDAVIGVTPSLSGAAVAARAARRAGSPWAVLVQDLVGQAARQSGIAGGGYVAYAAAALEGKLLRQADRVVVVSESFGRQVDEYGVAPGKVRLLPNWTHIPGPTGRAAEVRRELKWGEGVFVLLHTGNMGLKQGLHNVVEGARQLAGRRDILVVLMGDGSQRKALEERARGIDVLHFLRPVPGDRYADVLEAADLLLVNELPTVGEMSLPSKLTSYFAAGRPVLAAVSADGACARELAASGGGGLQVEPDQPAALVAAVDVLRADPDRRARMGAAGRTYAERSLGRAAAQDRVLVLAQDLLAARA